MSCREEDSQTTQIQITQTALRAATERESSVEKVQNSDEATNNQRHTGGAGGLLPCRTGRNSTPVDCLKHRLGITWDDYIYTYIPHMSI